MDLKNRLRDIQTDCRNRLHGSSPNRGSFSSPHIHGTHVPGGGAVHSIKSRHRSRMAAWFSGDRKPKESTARLAPVRPKPPTMSFDNRAADREAYAHAVGLRGVEGFKQTRQALRAQPMTGIPHRDAHALRLDTHRADV